MPAHRKYTMISEIDFNEFVDYYNTHSKPETCKHFNINGTGLRELCKLHNWEKDRKLVCLLGQETYFKKTGFKSNFNDPNSMVNKQSPSAKIKRRKSQEVTLLKKYNVRTIGELDITKESHKSPETRLAISKALLSRPQIEVEASNTQREITNESKYGIKYTCNLISCKEASHTEEAIAKANASRKLAIDNDPTIIERRKETYTMTCETRYGVKHYSQTAEFNAKCKKLYICDGKHFDSLPELSLWVYAKDHNEQIFHGKDVPSFEYTYNGRQYKYFPDFIYNGELIEIKGDQFFKEDGTMQNPFNHDEDDKYEAKHQCDLANGVQFYTVKDYMKYVDYFNSKYSAEDFLCRKQ